ncbi:DUF7373 family lipoprotein [Nocardia sp. NPDC055029]
MTKLRRTFAVTLVAVAALLTGGCGDIEGSTPSIDVSKLDSGNYPTRPIDATRTSRSGSIQESLNIANHTPIPLEYDNRYTYGSIFGYRQHVTPEEPPFFEYTGIKEKSFTSEIPGLVAGWRSFGQRRPWPSLGSYLETYTLRFETSDHARGAAQTLVTRTPGDPYSITGYPEALTKITPQDPLGGAKLRTWLVQGDILIYMQISDPVSRPADYLAYSSVPKKYFDKQIELLSSYRRTPLYDIAALPIDVDGMLSRTLPREGNDGDSVVYPARAVVSRTKLPAATKSAFDDAGVDYVANGNTLVYRARDHKAAERLSAAFSNGAQDLTGLKPADPPPNLPTAVCYEVDTADQTYSNLTPQCRIVVDRYVARITGANLQDAYQRTAAQYKLLAG